MADYDQYRAAYPDGPTMDVHFLAADGGEGVEEVEDEDFDDASSAFISNPDETDEDASEDDSAEPFTRPTTPALENYDASIEIVFGYDDDDEDNDAQDGPADADANVDPDHCFALPRKDDTAGDAAHDDGQFSFFDDEAADFTLDYPTSPYRVRATPMSWTGLEETAWGCESYICPRDGTLALWRERAAASGASAGMLARCSWVAHADRSLVAAPPTAHVPELKLTTPEGQELWLDDGFDGYAPGSDVFDFSHAEYGHWCSDDCVPFFDTYGWECFPQPERERLLREETEAEQRQLEEYQNIGESSDAPNDNGEALHIYARRVLEAIPEKDEDDNSDTGSEFSEIDTELLESIARMGSLMLNEMAAEDEKVKEAAAGQNGTAKEENTSFWDRDPTYISNMRWSDIVDEEEEDY
ncbi:hypothetical protein VTH06DRAFT_6416 [Thermothelomyces fergusii]